MLFDQGIGCTVCEVNSRYNCDRIRPRCQQCQQNGCPCDWDGGVDIFQCLSSVRNLNGKLSPTNPRDGIHSAFLGCGSFGDVYKARLEGVGFVAVKTPRRRDASRLRRLLVLSLREAQTWSSLSHRNILGLLGVTNDPSADLLSFVCPLMENGSVMEYILGRPEQNRCPLLSDIARGVRYLHGHTPPIVHGDLKGNNVLVSPDGRALLTDFGLSYVLELHNHCSGDDSSTSMVANARWCAPERLRPDLYGMSHQDSRTLASDVFAMLRTFLEILSGRVPFHENRNAFVVINLVVQGAFPKHPGTEAHQCGLTEGLWSIMQHGWAWKPTDRPSAAQVDDYLDFQASELDEMKQLLRFGHEDVASEQQTVGYTIGTGHAQKEACIAPKTSHCWEDGSRCIEGLFAFHVGDDAHTWGLSRLGISAGLS